MRIDSNKMDLLNFDIEKTAIFFLILNLVNNDQYRTYWIINWLAYFFQGLKKSQVALVLIGIQGSGKGIFFNEIIKPLFGETFTKTINDKSLNTKYKGALVEYTLFTNLDEISTNRSLNDSDKNFIKALVTNESITAEKKFENLGKETPLYSQILITSNEAYALEIEENDRRFTVFGTGDSLQNTNFQGLGSYEALSIEIKAELELFVCYLKAYSVDVKLANTALNTPEKDEMIHQYQMKQQVKISKQQKNLGPKLSKLERNIDEFIFYIKTKTISFFEPIKFENPDLYQIIISDLSYNIFRVENLLIVYKVLYGSCSIKTNSEFLRELQKNDPRLFAMCNVYSYLVGEDKKDFFNLYIPFQRRY